METVFIGIIAIVIAITVRAIGFNGSLDVLTLLSLVLSTLIVEGYKRNKK